MPGNGPQNMLEQVTSTFASRVQDYAKGMAEHIGGPLSGHELNQQEAVQRWNYTPLGSTELADQHYYDLLQQGMQPGQALDQVYPMRKQLMSGPDIGSIIDKAKQLADWSAQTTGKSLPPAYTQSTMPLLHVQQMPPPQPAAPPTASPGVPGLGPPPPGGPPGMPPAMPSFLAPPAPPLPAVPAPPGGQSPLPMHPAFMPPPATTAPPDAEAPLGGGMLPPGQGPTGNLQS